MNLSRGRTALFVLLVLSLNGLLLAQDQLISLTGWLVHNGDNPAWAQPDFDDSAWTRSGYPTQSLSATLVAGYRWYRTNFTVPADFIGRNTAICMAPIDEAWEVFVEGTQVGHFGAMPPASGSPSRRSVVLRLAPGLLKGSVAHVAIRRWNGNSATTRFVFTGSGAGSINHPPELGSQGRIEERAAHFTDAGIVANLPANFVHLLEFFAALTAFGLYNLRRRNVEYLYLALYCAFRCLPPLIGIAATSNGNFSLRSPFAALLLVSDDVRTLLVPLLLRRLCPRLSGPLLVVAGLGAFLALWGGFTLVYPMNGWRADPVGSPILLVICEVGVLGSLLVSAEDFGAVIITASLLVSGLRQLGTSLSVSGTFLGIPLRQIDAGPFIVTIASVADLPFIAAALIVFYSRLKTDRTRQASAEQELIAARRVQETLLGGGPDLRLSGFALDVAYLPAREVGGDFYQCIPDSDGSLLVVIGDVSGKGLDAAMLVATVVGGLGDLASRQPADVLTHLNRALAGKTRGGFVTCCCTLLQNDELASIANAGHIPPYMGDEPVTVESGLPLGVTADVAYPAATYQFGWNAQLTFVSDGVVEAADVNCELFGFERTRSISNKPAADIAEMARAWGQNDDITVLTVRRTA